MCGPGTGKSGSATDGLYGFGPFHPVLANRTSCDKGNVLDACCFVPELLASCAATEPWKHGQCSYGTEFSIYLVAVAAIWDRAAASRRQVLARKRRPGPSRLLRF